MALCGSAWHATGTSCPVLASLRCTRGLTLTTGSRSNARGPGFPLALTRPLRAEHGMIRDDRQTRLASDDVIHRDLDHCPSLTGERRHQSDTHGRGLRDAPGVVCRALAGEVLGHDASGHFVSLGFRLTAYGKLIRYCDRMQTV